eukprot:scaffold2275_cov101-Cylindrotheca_fusiformis.AAC.3
MPTNLPLLHLRFDRYCDLYLGLDQGRVSNESITLHNTQTGQTTAPEGAEMHDHDEEENETNEDDEEDDDVDYLLDEEDDEEEETEEEDDESIEEEEEEQENEDVVVLLDELLSKEESEEEDEEEEDGNIHLATPLGQRQIIETVSEVEEPDDAGDGRLLTKESLSSKYRRGLANRIEARNTYTARGLRQKKREQARRKKEREKETLLVTDVEE